jgi:hypothetical protein
VLFTLAWHQHLLIQCSALDQNCPLAHTRPCMRTCGLWHAAWLMNAPPPRAPNSLAPSAPLKLALHPFRHRLRSSLAQNVHSWLAVLIAILLTMVNFHNGGALDSAGWAPHGDVSRPQLPWLLARLWPPVRAIAAD